MNNLIIKSLNNKKKLSFFSFLFFLISIGLCAYLPAGLNDKLGTDNGKTFTISRALANANKISFLIILTITSVLVFKLVTITGPKKFLNTRIILLFLSYGFLISLLWVTVKKNEDLHYFFASIIFTSLFIFNLLTYYVYYKFNREANKDKKFIILLIILNVLCFLSLLVFSILRGRVDTDIFASLELLFSLLFSYILIFMGTY
jgi:hypothetical protein